MTIKQFRKTYPFIPYGSEYELWKKIGKLYKWLLGKIVSERPAIGMYHEWRKITIWFQDELKKRNSMFRNLPKPTKEQNYDNNDLTKKKKGKWPEHSMEKIQEFADEEEECWKLSRRVAAMLTENEYYVKVLKQKTYKSMGRETKDRKKNTNQEIKRKMNK